MAAVTPDTELQDCVAHFRAWGRVHRLVRVEPPTMPRSRKLREALQREARSDERVAAALAAAVLAEALKPGLRRRVVDADFRIY